MQKQFDNKVTRKNERYCNLNFASPYLLSAEEDVTAAFISNGTYLEALLIFCSTCLLQVYLCFIKLQMKLIPNLHVVTAN